MDNDGQYTITHHVGYLCRSIPRCAWWLFSDGPYRRLCEAHSGSGRVCRQIRTQVCNVVCSAPDTDILLHPFLDQPHSASPNHSTCVHRAQENHSDQRSLQRHVKERKNHIHLWHYANSLELHKHTSLEVNNKSRARHVLNNLMTVFLCNTVVCVFVVFVVVCVFVVFWQCWQEFRNPVEETIPLHWWFAYMGFGWNMYDCNKR